MKTDSERIERLEQEIAALTPTVRERLTALESRPVPKTLSDRLWGIGEKAIIPLTILLLGFVFKDSVEHALKQQQLELSAASQIQGLVEKLGSETQAESRSAAVTLAAFGDFATVALARQLQEVEGSSSLAAEEGLRSLALTGSPAACKVLHRMLVNRTQLYDWRVHKSATKLLGELECHNARGDLQQLNTLIEKSDNAAVKAYGDLVKGDFDAADVSEMHKAIQTALKNLERARQ